MTLCLGNIDGYHSIIYDYESTHLKYIYIDLFIIIFFGIHYSDKPETSRNFVLFLRFCFPKLLLFIG